MDCVGALLLVIFSCGIGALSLMAYMEYQQCERRRKEKRVAFESDLKQRGEDAAIASLQWCETQIADAQWELLQRRLGPVTPPPPPPTGNEGRCSVLTSLIASCDGSGSGRVTTGRISLCGPAGDDKPLPLLAKNRERLNALGFVVDEDGKGAVYDATILLGMQQAAEKQINK